MQRLKTAQKPSRPKGLKISQLAEQAGVSIPTIKHYLREGLIPRPVKTGRTMSYYDPDAVERVRGIKRLQTERFLPLSAIKKIIRSGKSMEDELALGEAMMCISELSSPEKRITRTQVERRSGYSAAELEKIERLGLIRPRKTDRGREFDPVDCQILSLIRQREEAGFSFEYSLDMMSIYRRHIQSIVREEAKLFARRLLPDANAREAARYIREGDRALGAFMPLIREKMARANAERIIESMDGARCHVKEALRLRLVTQHLGNTGQVVNAEGAEGMFWQCLLRALAPGKPAGRPFAPADENLAGFFRGLGALTNGRPDEACAHFRPASRSGRVRPLSTALEGIAHLLKAAHAPGLLAGMRLLQTALDRLRASHRRTPDRDVNLLVSYFRGVGLAVIPDLFDTHNQAARELARVTRPAETVREDLAGILSEELRRKAAYFLATMYLEDEAHEKAARVLAGMMKSEDDDFYHRWATRRMKAVGKSLVPCEGCVSDCEPA